MPSDSPPAFAVLLQAVRDGREGAAEEFLQRYGPHVIRVVRRRLSESLRSRFDSEDFTQAVWASFFADKPRITSFDSPEALMKYLASTAAHKVYLEYRRRFQTQKRGLHREHSLDSRTIRPQSLAARQPTASQLAVAAERWDRLLNGLPDHYRRIIELRRAGTKYKDIAYQLGVQIKTIQRVLRKLLARTAE